MMDICVKTITGRAHEARLLEDQPVSRAQLPAFARIPHPQFPANPLDKLGKFTEKPREFIDIYRIFQK